MRSSTWAGSRGSHHPDDVDAAYAEALQLGYEIVHPLTTETWGVRRVFVRAPDGNVINIVAHRDSSHPDESIAAGRDEQ